MINYNLHIITVFQFGYGDMGDSGQPNYVSNFQIKKNVLSNVQRSAGGR